MLIIILHNISTTWMITHSKTHCTLWKRMHHYLQVILSHHVITTSLKMYKIQTPFQKKNKKLYHQWEFICKVNINTEMSLAILTYNTMTSIMVMHSLSDNITTTGITKPLLVLT